MKYIHNKGVQAKPINFALSPANAAASKRVSGTIRGQNPMEKAHDAWSKGVVESGIHSTSIYHKNLSVKKTGKFQGKSNKLGHGGRAAQLKARGVPGGVIGELARAAHAAPGQENYHGKKHKVMCKKHNKKMCKICAKKIAKRHENS